MNFRNIEHLAQENDRQRLAYACLKKYKILELLEGFDPVHVSTISLGIDIPTSDLDILCEVKDFHVLQKQIEKNFAHYPKFLCKEKQRNRKAYLLASFLTEEFPIEIYGEDCPVEEQNAFRHACVHERLLNCGGPALQEKIQELKRTGVKTEAAFAQVLKLPGDPYLALLEVEGWGDEKLEEALKSFLQEMDS